MNAHRGRIMRNVLIGSAVLAIGSVGAFASIVTFRRDGISEYIGLRGGPAQVTARTITTPVGDMGVWHYHPGSVFNVVTQGTITIEDGCGDIHQYSAGQAFETSEGRIHRAYNFGAVDETEYNMFVGPVGRPITVNIPNNERRCGPPSTVEECKGGGWTRFDYPTTFPNQGACVAYVNHRPRVTVLVPEDALP